LAQEVRVKAYLLLTQLDEFDYALTVGRWNVDQELAIQVMAAQFRHFIDNVAVADQRNRSFRRQARTGQLQEQA
jgi:hypothetical protein